MNLTLSQCSVWRYMPLKLSWRRPTDSWLSRCIQTRINTHELERHSKYWGLPGISSVTQRHDESMSWNAWQRRSSQSPWMSFLQNFRMTLRKPWTPWCVPSVKANTSGSRWIVNLQRPVSVLNATVAIVLRRGTCGRSPACWACVSHILLVWMAKSMT